MPSWFHIDDTTGAIVTGGTATTDQDAGAQAAPTGQTLVVVPDGLVKNVFSPTPDFSALQAALCNQIESVADAVAATIITLSPRHVMTAFALKAESEALAANSTEPTPFLQGLATVAGTTVAQEKATFDAAWAAAVPPGALINATSIVAQRRVNAATTLAAITAAAVIDWTAVMATLGT